MKTKSFNTEELIMVRNAMESECNHMQDTVDITKCKDLKVM